MIYAVIVACEIGFWVLIALGLLARYPLHRPRLGAALLILVPVVDLILLIVTALDLRSGATPQGAHGLAAIYLGFSVAYGHRMIRWADIRFAYHWADGPPPEKLTGNAYTKHCWGDVVRTAGAVLLTVIVLQGLVIASGNPAASEAFSSEYRILAVIFTLEFLWAVSYTLWPRRAKA